MVRFARREPSAVLLAAQLGGVLLYPFMEGSAGRALFSIFGIAILGLVLLAVRSSPAWTWFGVLLALPASVLLVIQAVTGSDDLLPYSSAIEAVLYFYAAGALIAYMLADHEITRDELFAVGATFTLVAWAFAYSFTVLQAIEPRSFTAAIDPTGDRTWIELLFLSFTTLSSTGLSDVIPVKPFARSLVMIEQLAGVAYIAMVVSRLVEPDGAAPRRDRSRPEYRVPMAKTQIDDAAGLTAADVIHAKFSALPATATIGDVRDWFAVSTSRRMAFLVDGERYAGSVTPEDVAGDIDIDSARDRGRPARTDHRARGARPLKAMRSRCRPRRGASRSSTTTGACSASCR